MEWLIRLGRFAERMLIDALLVITGVIATYLAVRYTYGWHVWAGDPPVEALGFSLVIVLFSIMMFEFAVESSHKKSKWAIAMFAAWLITALYSMQATMAGQYIGIQRKALERLELVKEDKTSGVELENIKRQIELTRAELKPYQDRQVQLIGILKGIDTVEERYEWKKTVADTEKQLEETNKKITEYTEKITELEDRAVELGITVKLEELKGSSGDVFAFYSQVLGIEDVEKVEFWMTVYRSIALDTVNVLCFMMVIVRRRKRGQDKDYHRKERTEEPASSGEHYFHGRPNASGNTTGLGMAMESPYEALPEKKGNEESGKSGIEILAEDTYKPGRRNGTFTSWPRARSLGVDRQTYGEVVERGCKRGVLVKRKGVLYKNEYFGKEDFIREVLTEGW